MSTCDPEEVVLITPEEVKEAMCDEIAAALKKFYGVDIYELDREQMHAFLQKIATANKQTRSRKITKWFLVKAGEAATSRLILPVLFFGLRSMVLSHIF